jgi:POT family proton-dependent oligopeptide transporter
MTATDAINAPRYFRRDAALDTCAKIGACRVPKLGLPSWRLLVAGRSSAKRVRRRFTCPPIWTHGRKRAPAHRAAAGVGMTNALAYYLYASPMLPPDEMHKAKAAGLDKKPLDRNERCAILALIALFLPTTMFWATYEQQGNTIALWANDHTDRTIDLIVWHGQIPVTWFQAFNPFMIFTFTPLIVAFWAWQEKRGMEPSTVTKMALGCFGVALSYLIMAGAAWSAAGNSATWWWLFVYFIVITIGELYLSPIGLSLVSKIAPARMISTTMGLWLGTSFIGNIAAGWLGSFWSSMDKMSFFIMIAAVAASAGGVIWSFNHPLKGILQG